MSKLQFHVEENRQLESGVRDVVLFVSDPSDNDTGYKTGVPWDGVTAINENPSGADITDLYADDIKYASLQAVEKFAFSVEAYHYPPEFGPCDGSVTPSGVPGAYLGQQQRTPFALAYLTRIGDAKHPGMDAGDKLHIIYNSLASPSGRQYATINENPDAMTMSWDANSTPVSFDANGDYKKYKPVSTITFNSTDFTGGVESQNWQNLIKTIYGGEEAGEKSKLPKPDVLLAIAKG